MSPGRDYFSNPFEEGQSPFSAVKSYQDMVSGGPRLSSRGDGLGAARQRLARIVAQGAAAAPQLGVSTHTVGDGHNHGPAKPGAYTPSMLALRDYITNKYGISNVGGYANRNVAGTKTKSDHASHRAWDFMVGNDRSKGDAIAQYVIDNHQKYGVKNLIWYDRIWDPRRGWRAYQHPSGRNDPTLQHRDHPHVGFL